MQRVFSTMLIFGLTLFAMLQVVPSVFAENTNKPVYKDGEYEIPFTVLQGENNEVSVTEDYIESPAKVTVHNGQYSVEMNLKNHSWWQYFKVASGGDFIDVTEITKDEDANTSTVQFDVEDIDEILHAKVHIIVTGIPGFEYDSKYEIRFKFDSSAIPLVDSETEVPTEGSGIDLEDGNYTIGFDALHETEEKPSTAAGYIKNPATLSVKDGNGKMTLTLTDHETIKDYKVEQNGEFVSAEVVKVNEEANTRTITFDINNVEDVIYAKIKVYVAQMDYTGEYGLRLLLNEDRVINADEDIVEEDEEVNQELVDGLYTINYRVLHATKFEKSRMGDYMEAPAQLTLNENEKTVTITLTDHKAVTDFQIEKDGKFQKALVKSVDEKNNTRDITFEIDSLDAVMNAKVAVSVEAANYTGEYEVRLFFEENSVKKVVSFSDINDHWAKDYIQTANINGWFNGYPDGSFGPEKKVKRIHSASLFSRILGLTNRVDVPFIDIGSIDKATKEELEKAYANGIVKGLPNGEFKPYGDVTRAQFALMIYRTYEKVTGTRYEPKETADFPDIVVYDEETQKAISMLVELGIAQGSQGKFNPSDPATRAQAAKMLVNFKAVLDN